MTGEEMHKLYAELPAYDFFEMMEADGYSPEDLAKCMGGEPIAEEYARWIYLTQK